MLSVQLKILALGHFTTKKEVEKHLDTKKSADLEKI
jgi:hypothetical protein